jgi:hypothetical protein
MKIAVHFGRFAGKADLGKRGASAAAQTRIVSVARIRLDPRKIVRPFKGIICRDISEFEYRPARLDLVYDSAEGKTQLGPSAGDLSTVSCAGARSSRRIADSAKNFCRSRDDPVAANKRKALAGFAPLRRRPACAPIRNASEMLVL